MFKPQELTAFADFATLMTGLDVQAYWEEVAGKVKLTVRNETGTTDVGEVRPSESAGEYTIKVFPSFIQEKAPEGPKPPKPGGETPDVVPPMTQADNPQPNVPDMQDGPGMRQLPS